jgi:hypothetical protein
VLHHFAVGLKAMKGVPQQRQTRSKDRAIVISVEEPPSTAAEHPQHKHSKLPHVKASKGVC